MIHALHDLLLKLHIGIGLVAIVAFWLPILTRKGSRWHVRSGRLYTWSMYAVSASAFVMCLMVLVDPIGVVAPERNLDPEVAYRNAYRLRGFAAFLLMLSLLVFASARHGLLALRTTASPRILARPTHRALLATLGVVSVIVGYLGVTEGEVLLMVFAVLGTLGSFTMLRDSLRTQWTRRNAIMAHFDGLIGTGVGAYTAVFAFGGSRLMSEVLPGQWIVVAWVLPAIIGTIAISRLKKRYQARDTAVPASRAAQPVQA